MQQSIAKEFQTLWELIRTHYVAIVVVSVSTLMMILMEIKPSFLPFFPQLEFNLLLYYGLIPLLTGLAVLRLNPLKLGLGVGDYKFWLPASCLYLVVALPVVYLGTHTSSIQHYYQTQQFDFSTYILHLTLYLLAWEFLFRGFMLFGLKDSLKEGAILIQMIPFTLLHFGKPDAEIITCIFSGLVWGYVCYRGNSLWPAFLMHMIVNLTNKLLIVGMI